MTSPDGINWTERTSDPSCCNHYFSVAYGEGADGVGLWVAVSNTNNAPGSRVMTSPDGITWTARTATSDSEWRGVAYGNGLWVAVTAEGLDRVMISSDGINWTARTTNNNGWRSVVYANGLWVAVALSGEGNRVMTSGAVIPGPASQLAITTQPTNTISVSTITPAITVQVQDQYGIPVTSSTASVTLAITAATGTSGAVLSGTTTVDAVDGVATFSALTIDKAGTGYTLTATSEGLTGATSSGFEVTSKDASTLTVEAMDAETYSGSAITPPVVVLDGQTPLTEGLDYTLAYSDNTAVGTATVTLTFQGNFSGTRTTTFTITPAALTVIAAADQSKVYGATDPTLTFTATGFVNNDTESILTGSLVRAAGENVGSYTISQGTLSAGNNYTIAFTGADFTITPAPPTELRYPERRGPPNVYGMGGTSAVPTIDLGGGTANFAITAPSPVPPGITIDAATGVVSWSSTLPASTYLLEITATTDGGTTTTLLTIRVAAVEALELTIADIDPQTYMGVAIEPMLTVKDGGTQLLLGTDYTVAYMDNVNFGTATATITGIGNYSGTTSVTFVITPATLTLIAIADQSKVYGATDPALTFTATGFVNNDTESILTGSLARAAGENVGTYTINQGTLSAGNNYTIAFTGADFTIRPAALSITADNKQRAFGEANPALTFRYNGLVNGDTRIAVEPTLSTTAGIDSQPGDYPIVVSGGSDPNYEITRINGILRVELTELGQVRNLSAQSGDRTVVLNWEAPDPGAELVEGYLLERSEDGSVFGEAEQVNTREVSVSGLSNNQPYWFKLRAFAQGVVGDEKIIGPITPLAIYSDGSGTVPQQSPGSFGILIDEQETEVELEESEGGVVLRAPGLMMELESLRASGDRLASIDAILVLEPRGTLEIRGEGFRPGTRVSVWLIGNTGPGPNDRSRTALPYFETRIGETENGWSEQSRLMNTQPGTIYFLDLAEVSSEGKFGRKFNIPADITPGTYTLQTSGITASGSPLVLSIGAVLPSDVDLDSEGDGVPDFVADLSLREVAEPNLKTA